MSLNILSIQSQVAYGYVGNNIASFGIQLHGINMVAMPTVLLSTHTDHDVFYGEDISPRLFQKLMKGVRAIPVYDDLACTVSGYINNEEIIDLTSVLVSDWKKVYANKPYVYDPVFGDARTDGLYIHEEVVSASIRKLLPLCDILTPNQFELEYILQCPISSVSQLLKLINNHPFLVDKQVVLTSAMLDDTPEDMAETIWLFRGQVRRFRARKIPIDSVGTGDLFTSILAAQLTLGRDIHEAIAYAMVFVEKALENVLRAHLIQMDAASLMKAYHACYQNGEGSNALGGLSTDASVLDQL